MGSAPRLRVCEVGFHQHLTRTRFPFRYGIASMTEAPHLFVRSVLEVNGERVEGIASEGLPPKWFTKNPSTTFEEDDLPGMERSIRNAASIASGIGESLTFFEFWELIKSEQRRWAEAENVPPLLAQLGTALIERTVLDGLGRAVGVPFHEAVRRNALGIELGAIHGELRGIEVGDVFDAPPLKSMRVRHTVGLADPLSADEIPSEDRAGDGLPQALVDCIRVYGLDHFKIKLCGDLEKDRERLRSLTAILRSEAPDSFRITIDGNEQYSDVAAFRAHFEELQGDPSIESLFEHLIFVEQPIHRDLALDDSVRDGLRDWKNAPPVIIDESDAHTGCLPLALELGYSGTSHKNCKGVIKSLANRALLNRTGGIMSAEDLANVGPVALQQDLAVVATLGIDHAERNGHHYFAGLSIFPGPVQEAAVEAHPDLYESDLGFPSLRIQEGRLELGSVNAAPFGTGLRPSDFKP